MTQSLSVSCKLQVPDNVQPTIDRTMEGFADACNQILVAAQLHKCYNATKLHHLTYKAVREATGLKANHVCQAMRRVLSNLKTTKKIRKFRPASVSLDARTFVYHPNSEEVGVTLIDKRHTFKLLIGNYQRALLNGQTPTSATLVKRRDGNFYVNIAIELDTPPTGKTPKVVGVDLGRRHIATTSTGKVWNGTQLQAVRDRYTRVRANVSSKRTRSSRKLLLRLCGRERRFQESVNHNITPAYTSQTCSRCHHLHPEKGKSYRNGKKFKCGHCGFEHDSDFNAAINIAQLGVVYVNQPEIPGITCLLEGQLSLFPTGESWDKAPHVVLRSAG